MGRLSAAGAGRNVQVYATDPGLAKPGWFIDNLSVTAGDETIFASDFDQDVNAQQFFGSYLVYKGIEDQLYDRIIWHWRSGLRYVRHDYVGFWHDR